jgi:hypothetical protein
MSKNRHVTDRASDALSGPTQALTKRDEPGVLGPSTNPATNMLIADVALRAVSRLARNTLHKTVLQTRVGSSKAKRIVENKSMGRTVIMFGLSRLATRSVPGALLVSGGLIAKTLYDRSHSRRAARRKGASEFEEMARE